MKKLAALLSVTLLLPTGAGAASQQSLGTVVFGGMLASTLLAIPFVPVFFVSVRHIFGPLSAPAVAPGAPRQGPAVPSN